MILAATGHRPNKLGEEYDYKGVYSDYLCKEFKKIFEEFEPEKNISGMALGVDTLWAMESLRNKIPVLAAVPFKNQDRKWPERSRNLYRRLLACKKVEFQYTCTGGYAPWKMQARNQWMVDRCDLLIAVHDGSSGGTANCIDYAKRVGREIRFIDPNGWKQEIRFIDPNED